MPKLRVLSSREVVKIFDRFDFAVIGQTGSHIKMRRVTSDEPQTITVPRHRELDRGTLRAIFNQASRYIDANELREHFYTK